MKKKPKKLHLSKETLSSLELASVGGAKDEMTAECVETLRNLVCSTMP